MHSKLLIGIAAFAATLAAPAISATMAATNHADVALLAAMDTGYQLAVARNDWQGMDRVLHPDFTLVLGNGTVYSRADLIESARDQHISYEQQVEVPGTQTVRLYGNDTAIITALLWLKGTRKKDQSTFEYKLWFSDTYVRTAQGWKYAFGQASLRLP
jgi:ketosteroid isomerase-like protein